MILLAIIIATLTIIMMYILAEPAMVYNLGNQTMHFALGK
jgi:hypothetical protein